MTTKNLTMENIKVIFKKMLKEREVSIVQKDQEMFHKQEQSILALISGNNSLTNQRLDNLSKDLNDLKESFPKMSMMINSRISATKFKNW